MNTHDVEAVTEADPDHALWDAVRKLTVKQRTTLVMRYLDDMTQAQIADHLQVAPGTVSATLTQARRHYELISKEKRYDSRPRT